MLRLKICEQVTRSWELIQIAFQCPEEWELWLEEKKGDVKRVTQIGGEGRLVWGIWTLRGKNQEVGHSSRKWI